MSYFYVAPTCFDSRQNGSERGVDCGGGCQLVCAFDVMAPTVEWARSFRVTEGQYNAVAYVENNNGSIATPALNYTFKLFDEQGLITERQGTTALPANNTYPIFEGGIQTGNRVPRQTILELDPVREWYPSIRGRETFITNTFDLQGEGTTPRLDVEMSNQSFDDINDIEIVATIFDRSGNALTSSQTYVDRFGARTTESLTFTWPEPIAGTLRSCDVATDVVLAIDLSGSMNNDNDNPPEPLTTVLAAARGFVGRLQPDDQVGLVTFATEAAIPQLLTRDSAAAATLVSELAIDPVEETGSTNTGDALVKMREVLSASAANPDARKLAILLTDGLATAPDEEPEAYALEAAAALKRTGAQVYSIGIGEQVNQEFVRALASNADTAFFAITAQQIDAIYRTITSRVCEDGPARIDIVPVTGDIFNLDTR